MTTNAEVQLSKPENSQLLEALLEPIVALCIRECIPCTELAPVIEGLYVKLGREDFGVRTRPGNKAVIAAVTGLGRKLAAMHVAGTVSPKANRLKKLLLLWTTEPPWVAEDGRPNQLPLTGDPSFASLCSSAVIGDSTAFTWVRVLEKYGFARQVGDSAVKLLIDRTILDRPFGLSDPVNRPYVESAATMLWVLAQQIASQPSATETSQVVVKLLHRAKRHIDAVPPSTLYRLTLVILRANTAAENRSDEECLLVEALENILGET